MSFNNQVSNHIFRKEIILLGKKIEDDVKNEDIIVIYLLPQGRGPKSI
jgi:hypothetical protein